MGFSYTAGILIKAFSHAFPGAFASLRQWH